jgi:hypothetical protein
MPLFLSRLDIGLLVMNLRIVLAACLCVSLGCNGGKSDLDKGIVSGTVTFDGTPVTNGQILFLPIEGTKGAASGASVVDGNFTVKGKGGIPFGKHRVEIRAAKPGAGGIDQQYLPSRYNDSSTLTAEVNPDTEQLEFALTSK